MGLYVRQLKLGPMDNFVYLLGAEDSPETAIVDPAWDVPAALRAAEKDGRSVTHALLSHHHHDHVNGLEDVLAHGGIRVHAHRADVPRLPPGLQREVTPLDALNADAVERHTEAVVDKAGSLDVNTYASLVAFILQSNGAQPGTDAFTPAIQVWAIGVSGSSQFDCPRVPQPAPGSE